MPPRLRMNPFSPSLLTRFIIFSMSACCFRSLLTSWISTPEPLAMRFLREAWIRSGLRRSLGVFDQRDDIAHAEDAAGDAVGMERLEGVELLADADQLDRPAGDGAHRQCR